MTIGFRLRPAAEADFEAVLDLSVRVMRDHLERIGRFDPARRRARMRAHFDAGGMRVIEDEGGLLGSVGLDHHPGWIELHSLYLEPARQGRGLGAALFATLRAGHPGRAWRIEVLRGSPARRFWERQGFQLIDEQPFDWVMERPAD